MKNPAQTGSGCIRFNDIKVENATFAEYSCPIRLRGRYIYMWQSKREISREFNTIIGSAKGSQISENIEPKWARGTGQMFTLK
jgi:hypothetical protein